MGSSFSTHERRRPSKSQTAKARSTNCPGLKTSLPNGAGTLGKARAIVPSRPPRSISCATATEPAHFAPLENIGLSQSDRPRTATSTKTKECLPYDVETRRPATSHAVTTNTSLPHFAPLKNIGLYQPDRPRTATSTKIKKCLPYDVETRRPATSHAATTNTSLVHSEVGESSCIGSKPGLAYSNSPQPKGSAYPPCPTPEYLDDNVHPAYRKVPGTDENVHPLGESDRRGATNSSVLSTQGQKRAKPGTAYSNSPQPKGSACPPCPTPKDLDDDVHPAYRKVPETDENVRKSTTDERINHLKLRRSPRKDQQRPQFEKNNRRGVANSSVLSTQGQKPNVPSPPLLSLQAKHSSPSHMASFDTTSSSRSDQSPTKSPTQGRKPQESPPPTLPLRSQTTESSGSSGSSRTAASSSRSDQSTTKSPTQGRKPQESPPPQLPLRSQTTESSGSSASSGTAAIFDTSRSRYSQESNATTIFSETGGGTTIATEEFDFSALLRLGPNFGVGQPDFDWSLTVPARVFEKKCKALLKTGDRRNRIDAVELLQAGISSGDTAEVEHAKKAWSSLSPDESSLRKWHITTGFCHYFYHVYATLRSGKEIPYHVPVNIRAIFDPLYTKAREKMENAKGLQDHDLARWIDGLDGQKQGISLIALLELNLHTKGPLKSRDLLKTILELMWQVKTLQLVSEDQISNFFATYVRAFRNILTDARQGRHEDILEQALDYFLGFWALCTAQYNKDVTSNYLSLFKATIRKLDNIDIPLCLWIFLTGTGSASNMGDPDVTEIYLAMETELNRRLPSEVPSVVPVFMTVQFLLTAKNFGFFDNMHYVMCAQGRDLIWRCVWHACQRAELYTMLSHQAEVNRKTAENMISLIRHYDTEIIKSLDCIESLERSSFRR